MELEIKKFQKNKNLEGKCCVCGEVKYVKNHHIFPKRYRNHNEMCTKILWSNPKHQLCYVNLPIAPYKIMVQVCMECHQLLHPENWKFNLNEKIVKGEVDAKQLLFLKEK